MKKSLFAHNITRRDFLNGTSAGMGAMLLGLGAPNALSSQTTPRSSLGQDWYGYGGVGDYRTSHGNTPEMVADAHRLRDRGFAQSLDQIESEEEYDYVVVGCGIAGLSAGLEFSKTRKDGQSCLMLDNHPIFGGEAKENEFDVNGTRLIAPQGANGFFIPESVDDPAAAMGDPRYYAELGLPREFQFRDWPDNRKAMKFCADNYGYLVKGLQENTSVGHFFNDVQSGSGSWAIDMWANQLKNTPLSQTKRENLLRWYHTGAVRDYASDAEAIADLDRMSYKEFLEKELGFGPEAAGYSDLFLASANGLGSDATSAYAAYKLPMSGFMDMPPPELKRTSFPGGNSGFARYFLKRLIPRGIEGADRFEDIITRRINFQALDRPDQPIRMRFNSTVLSVKHEGPSDSAEGVRLVYIRDGKLHAIRAKGVVMATGSWINRHVVRDLPTELSEACSTFQYAPFLVANVALNNWHFLYKLGISAAIWDRAEGDFGYTCNIRNPMQVGNYQPPLDPNKPTVLTFYTPFYYPGLDVATQGAMGRGEMMATSYSDYERQIYEQMMKLFGSSGFNPQRDVSGVILNRWGHAYSVPYPGFYGGKGGIAPRDIIRKGYGRIAFGHAELDGLQHYGPAADEGRRAMTQVLT